MGFEGGYFCIPACDDVLEFREIGEEFEFFLFLEVKGVAELAGIGEGAIVFVFEGSHFHIVHFEFGFELSSLFEGLIFFFFDFGDVFLELLVFFGEGVGGGICWKFCHAITEFI